MSFLKSKEKIKIEFTITVKKITNLSTVKVMDGATVFLEWKRGSRKNAGTTKRALVNGNEAQWNESFTCSSTLVKKDDDFESKMLSIKLQEVHCRKDRVMVAKEHEGKEKEVECVQKVPKFPSLVDEITVISLETIEVPSQNQFHHYCQQHASAIRMSPPPYGLPYGHQNHLHQLDNGHHLFFVDRGGVMVMIV